jgi:hypothetical protein
MSLEILSPTAFGAPVLLAYLDPGSGSYLLQLLIAGLLGGAFVIKSQWARIRAWFSRKSPPEDPGTPDPKA